VLKDNEIDNCIFKNMVTC